MYVFVRWCDKSLDAHEDSTSGPNAKVGTFVIVTDEELADVFLIPEQLRAETYFSQKVVLTVYSGANIKFLDAPEYPQGPIPP